MCDVEVSEEMVSETCVPSLFLIDNTIKQLENNVSLIKMYCLRLFAVYQHDCNVTGSEGVYSE